MMNPGIKDIYWALWPLKNRIHLNNGIICLFVGTVAAGIAALVLSFLALIVPVPFIIKRITLIYLSCFLISCIAAIFSRPRISKVLKTADSLGLKERLITACELRDDNSPLALLQRNDAFRVSLGADFKSLYPFRLPLKLAAAGLILVLLTAGIHIIPSSSKEKAAKTEALKKEIQLQAEKIEKERKNIAKQSDLSAEKLKEFNKKIDELLKELKKSDNEDKALKALSKTKNELQELKTNKFNDELLKAASNFLNNPIADSLAKGLKSESKDDLRKNMEELKKKISQLSSEDRKKLAEAAKEFLSKISDNKELMSSMKEMARALASGNQAAIDNAIASLEDSVSNMMTSNSQADGLMSQAIDRISDSLNDSKYEIAGMDDNAEQSAQAGLQGGDQAGEGSGNGDGDGAGEGNGDGNGKGPGSNGNGSGPGGGGAGKGSSNKDAGYTGAESRYASRERSDKDIKDFESIYVPDRLGGDNKQSQVKGKKNNSGQSQWKEADVPVEKGSILPYNEVFGEYKNEAITSIQGDTVPPVMKDVVRDYFSSLE